MFKSTSSTLWNTNRGNSAARDDINRRIENSLSPSTLVTTSNVRAGDAVTATSSLSSNRAVGQLHAVADSSTNIGGITKSSFAGTALSAIRSQNNNQRSHAQASPELMRSWREPFQTLQRLVDRSHQQHAEEARKAAGIFSSSSTSFLSSTSAHVRKFGSVISQSRRQDPTSMMSSSPLFNSASHRNNNNNNNNPEFYSQFLTSTTASLAGDRNDPFAQLDRLYSKAKRKWVDLCVTLRVPESERMLIEKQISQRDDVIQMNTALSILHSEIERLVELYHWGGILRKTIDEREKALLSFFSLLADFSTSSYSSSSASISSVSATRADRDQKQQQHQHVVTPSSASPHQTETTTSEIVTRKGTTTKNFHCCLKILEKLLQLRHLTADVYTAHRKWQVAHGTTNSVALFIHRGASYLEKMMHDVASVIDTDSSDMDRAINREARRAARITQQDHEDEENNKKDSTNENENDYSKGESDDGTTKKNRKQTPPNSSRPSSSGRSRHQIIRSSNPSPPSPTTRHKSQTNQSSESCVIRQLPDWLFAAVTFRVSRNNPFLDTRKRRSLPMLSAISRHRHKSTYVQQPQQQHFQVESQEDQENDFDDSDRFQQMMLENFLAQNIQPAMDKADQALAQLLLDRCGWTIDDYFHSASRSMSDIKATWKRAAHDQHSAIAAAATNPKNLGIVRTEFLRDLGSACNFVIDHERAVVDRLVEKSIQRGMYGDEEQHQQFNQLVRVMSEKAPASSSSSSTPPKPTWNQNHSSAISALMEASQVMAGNSADKKLIPSASSSFASGLFSSQPRRSSSLNSAAANLNPQIRSLIRIQKAIRCFLARKVARQLWHQKIAATIIQKWVKRFLARCRVSRLRRRWKAACRIQAFYRACVIRRHIRPDIRRRRQEELDRRAKESRGKATTRSALTLFHDQEHPENHQQQQQQQQGTETERTMTDLPRILIIGDRSIMISLGRRGASVKESGKTLREHVSEVATKIQAAFRGHREYRFGRGVDVREWRMILHVNSAAAKIQAAVRGFLVRRELKMVRKLLSDVKLMQRVGRAYLSRWRDLW